MTIKDVAYGHEVEDGQEYFYVQTRCGEEHYGGSCDCKEIGHYETLALARFKAEMLAKQLNVPVQYDNEVNK